MEPFPQVLCIAGLTIQRSRFPKWTIKWDIHWGFRKIRGTLLGGPYNKDVTIIFLGSLQGFPCSGILPLGLGEEFLGGVEHVCTCLLP